MDNPQFKKIEILVVVFVIAVFARCNQPRNVGNDHKLVFQDGHRYYATFDFECACPKQLLDDVDTRLPWVEVLEADNNDSLIVFHLNGIAPSYTLVDDSFLVREVVSPGFPDAQTYMDIFVPGKNYGFSYSGSREEPGKLQVAWVATKNEMMRIVVRDSIIFENSLIHSKEISLVGDTTIHEYLVKKGIYLDIYQRMLNGNRMIESVTCYSARGLDEFWIFRFGMGYHLDCTDFELNIQ